MSRAGRFVTQIQGYKAFLPAPLPPSPPVAYDEALVTLREDHQRLIREHSEINSAYGLPLLDRLYQQPLTTVRLVQQWLGCSYATANKVARQLVDVGLLREMTGLERNRRFSYEPYLALFEHAGRGANEASKE